MKHGMTYSDWASLTYLYYYVMTLGPPVYLITVALLIYILIILNVITARILSAKMYLLS